MTRRQELERELVDAMAAVREPADLGAVYAAQGRLAAHAFGPVLDRTELYGVRDGRTGLHLTRSAADEVLEARMAAECRPWLRAELELAGNMDADAFRRLWLNEWRAGDDHPRPPVPGGEPAQRVLSVHAAEGDRGLTSPPAPAPQCSTPGSLGRHPIPAGAGVRSCPCGTVTRHPAR